MKINMTNCCRFFLAIKPMESVQNLGLHQTKGTQVVPTNRPRNADETISKAINSMKYKYMKGNIKAFEGEQVGDQEDHNWSFLATSATY